MSIKFIENYSGISQLKEKLQAIGIIKDFQTFNNSHFEYFERYFKDIKIQSIIIEFPYIDKDYLEDYSNYYSRSFFAYGKECARVHLFKCMLSESKFKNESIKDQSKYINNLKDKYAGFIVIKPLPQTVIGKTCVETYPNENERFFFLNREYTSNLFGHCFKINSIAFQEQDSAVSACATSALWSAFHSTSYNHGHNVPSPYEITKSAIKIIPHKNRSFPNKGLSSDQIIHAIRNVGLESITLSPQNKSLFKAAIFAYHSAGIPIILGLNMYGKVKVGDYHEIGNHAVLISGYKLKNGKDSTYSEMKKSPSLVGDDDYQTYLLSEEIDKIFVHDDQVGPFAKVDFKDNIKFSDDSDQLFFLSSTWQKLSTDFEDIIAIPESLIIPIYHKIRIPFDLILSTVISLNNYLQNFEPQNSSNTSSSPLIDKIRWKVCLSNINSFKWHIRTSPIIDKKRKVEILTSNYPKYLWIVEADTKKGLIFTLVFDATDLEQGTIFLESIHYSDFYNFLLSRPDEEIKVKFKHLQTILDWHKKKASKASSKKRTGK